MKTLLLAALLPLAVQAQFSLYLLDGTTETLLAPDSVYTMRPMEAGDTQTVNLRVRNIGTQRAEITRFIADGVGFALNRPFPPVSVEPGGFINGTLTFSASTAAAYSSNVLLNNALVRFVVSVNPGPVLTISESCTTFTANVITFGLVARGLNKTCDLLLTNPTAAPMTVSTLSVTGAGFVLTRGSAPMTLAAAQTVPLGVTFTAASIGVLTGTLRIQGREYGLHGIGAEAVTATPLFEFDTSAPGSGQQRRLSLRLPSAATVSGSGTITLAFQPDSTSGADDAAIQFLPNGRSVRFTFTQGSTVVTIEGQAFATFQTGTTAGRIQFTVTPIGVRFDGTATATVILPPSPVMLDKSIATRFPDRLDVAFTGFDNTFTTGAMLFRFYDAKGQQLFAAMPGDFTGAFRAFFATMRGGSTFHARLTFPVNGDAAPIAAVEFEISNAAGTTRSTRITF